MKTTLAFQRGLSVVAALFACGCDDANALLVGSDVRSEGDAASAFDATTRTTASTLTVAIAEDVPDACGGGCVVLTARATGGLAPYTYRWSPSLAADGGVAEACPTAATRYTVTVTDSATHAVGEVPTSGATASASVTIDPSRACGSAGDAGPFVYWAEWQSVDAGTMSGVLAPPSGTIQVVYTGELSGSQTTTGTNEFMPSSTFTSATVADPPPGPGMIEVGVGLDTATGPDTLTFSKPVTNPVLAIYNLGTIYTSQAASLVFGVPFTVLSSGLNAGGAAIIPGSDAALFGNEMLTSVDGGVSGIGSNGLVELEGTFSTIQWTNPSDLAYAGFTGITVGIRAQHGMRIYEIVRVRNASMCASASRP